MRITMMAIGSTGDVYPYTILGGELRRRGHDVTIAAFSHFEKAVKDAGLRFFPLPGDASRFVDSLMQPELNVFNYLPNLEKEILPYAGPLLEAMTASCADAEGLVSTFFGSVPLTVAEKYGIPFVQTHYYPMDANSEAPIPVTPQLPVGGKAGYNQLTYHELVKVRFSNNKDAVDEISRKLEEATKSTIVAITGFTAVFFRQDPKSEDRIYRI